MSNTIENLIEDLSSRLDSVHSQEVRELLDAIDDELGGLKESAMDIRHCLEDSEHDNDPFYEQTEEESEAAREARESELAEDETWDEELRLESPFLVQTIRKMGLMAQLEALKKLNW